MRMLITSGGTRVPIDDVRSVANTSTGAFGAAIVRAALQAGHEVAHLRARDSVDPAVSSINHLLDEEQQHRQLASSSQSWREWRSRYKAHSFVTAIEYGRQLELLLHAEHFDIAILAAAVSDFFAEGQPGKLSSDSGDLVLRLKRLPKYIAKVKDWAPSVYLVGFKLLVDASELDLIAAAQAANFATRADATVANDLATLKAGAHAIHLVRRDGHEETFTRADDPAARLIERVAAWAAKGENRD